MSSNKYTYYEYIARLENLRSSVKNLSHLIQGFKLQKDLKTSFEKFGLTKGTWMAIQSLPEARALFTEIPSLESLNAVGTNSVDIKSTKISKTAVIADWLDNTADGVNNFIETSKYHLNGLVTSLEEIADSIEKFGIYDNVVYAVSEEKRYEQCEHLQMAFDILKTVDPGNIDHSRLDDVKEHLSHVNGMCRMGYDELPGPSGMYCVEELEEATLSELGYDVDNLIDLCEFICDLLEDSIDLIDAKGDLIASQLTQESDNIRSVDDSAPVEENGITDESDISQEDKLMEHVSALNDYVSTVVCQLDCVGHVALNMLSTGSSSVESK